MALINCPECGKQVSDKASTCPNCGVTLNASISNSHSQLDNSAAIKCPKCGGTNLQAVADVKGKGASFWKICLCGILGLCGTGKTTTEHFWVCQSCGNKFKL